ALLAPADFLTPTPIIAEPSAEALSMLLDVRELLGIADHDTHPATMASQRLSERCSGQSRREQLNDLLTNITATLERRIAQLLNLGIHDTRILRTADFGGLRPLEIHNAEMDAQGRWVNVLLYCGLLESLPADHPAHRLLPLD